MTAVKRKKIDIKSKPQNASVIVLEDQDDTSRYICEALEGHGMSVHRTKNLEEFEHGLKADEYDVGSVDWNINGFYQGQEALAQLSIYEEDAGKVVFSVHADEEEVVQRAMNEKADFVLEKLGSDFDHYLATVEEAARLGLSRRIANQLREMGRWSKDLSEPPWLRCIREVNGPQWLTCSLDESVEAELFRIARKAAFETALAGEESELMDLIKKRGWWPVFDPQLYAESPWECKLTQMLDYVGANVEDLAEILNIDVGPAGALLADDGGMLCRAPEVAAEADKLLSVLAYVLRLSGYEPELMTYFWEQRDLFRQSLNTPPWDKLGLSKYLKINRTPGINEALLWIRRH